MTKKQTTLNQSIIWNTLGNIFYLFSQWVLTIIVLRIGGFADAGVFAIAITLSNIFVSIALYGMRNFQIADINDNYGPLDYVGSRIISTIFSLLIAMIFLYFNKYLYSIDKILVIFAYTLFRCSEAIFDVYSGFFQKKWRVDVIGKSLLIRGVANTTAFVLTLYLSKNLLLATSVMAITAYICIGIYDIHIFQSFRPFIAPSLQKIKLLLKKCLPLLTYGLILTVIGSIPRYLLDYYYDEALVGAYNSIATPTIIVQAVAIQIFNPFISLFSEAITNKNISLFQTTLRKCLIILGSLSLVAVLGSIFLGDFALKILYGREILPYTYLLLPLIIATILNATAWLLSALLTVYQRLNTLMIINFLSMILCFVAAFILIPRFALQGTTFAMILPMLFQIVLLGFSLAKEYKEMQV